LLLALSAGACSGLGTDLPGVADRSRTESVQLTSADVRTIIAQAATQAMAVGLPSTIAVVDHQGIVLGLLQMAGTTTITTLSGGGSGGLEGYKLGGVAAFAAISKAGTGAFLSTQGHAFSTRTTSFIVQQHFPPLIDPSPGGPLFGVQLSNLRCSDIDRGPGAHTSTASNLPLGLSADLGGLPLYKGGVAVGGIGVEGDGIYSLERAPLQTTSNEEIIAAAGAIGFAAPDAIHAEQVFVDGIRLVFSRAETPESQTTTSYETFAAAGKEIVPPKDGPESAMVSRTLGEVQGTVPPRFGSGFLAGMAPSDAPLTVDEVTQVLTQAAAQADITRAAIRLPIGTKASVSIAVVDAAGNVLGMFRTIDAPIFGFDVAAQKARTAAFFSSANAASSLTEAGLGMFVAAAQADQVPLDGSHAFSSRAVGFLSQPIYPPGAIAPYMNGTFSEPLSTWSIFNTGLQTEMYLLPMNASPVKPPCAGSALSALKNGITIFPGGFPLYKNGKLVGGVGVSGDGVDQDDLISFKGSAGFEAPAVMRADRLTVRGAALPYSVFPRHPDL
jgi:uncharacterized protein GlcG (DUF336 family)